MIVSLRPNRKRMLALVLTIAALLVLFLVIPRAPAKESAGLNLRAETADQRAAFLGQFGWEIEPKPILSRKIVIPKKFDDVYKQYNKIQKSQNMDLEKYAGKTCTQWVYKITNYQGYDGEVHATILVYNGLVIGGDISSAALDGFMCGFSGENAENSSAPKKEKSSEMEAKPQTSSKPIPANAWPTD